MFNGGVVISQRNNLFGDLTGCGLNALPTDLVANDALLLPAGDTGGGLPTLSPRITSLLVDAGDPTACPDADARGVGRPLDGNNDGIGVCDIGAVELKNDFLFRSGFEQASRRRQNGQL